MNCSFARIALQLFSHLNNFLSPYHLPNTFTWSLSLSLSFSILSCTPLSLPLSLFLPLFLSLSLLSLRFPSSLSPPPPSLLPSLPPPLPSEDAYRIDAEIDGEVVGLDILDTAGQEVFSAVRDRYMRDGEGFLLVYSLLERSTFVGITKISEQIKRVKDTDKHVPIILIGNKVL